MSVYSDSDYCCYDFTTHVVKQYKVTAHLFVRSLSHTHHEEEQSYETDSLHRCDQEKDVGLDIRRCYRHFYQLRQGQGADARDVQMLSQAEGKGKHRQGGGHQPTKHKVAHTLLDQLHL